MHAASELPKWGRTQRFMTKMASFCLHSRHFGTFLSQPVDQTFYPLPHKNTLELYCVIGQTFVRVCLCWKHSGGAFYFNHSLQNQKKQINIKMTRLQKQTVVLVYKDSQTAENSWKRIKQSFCTVESDCYKLWNLIWDQFKDKQHWVTSLS